MLTYLLGSATLSTILQKYMAEHFPSLDSIDNFLSEMLETVGFVVHGLPRVQNMEDILMLIGTTIRLVTKKTLGALFQKLIATVLSEPDVQSFDFKDLQYLFSSWDSVKNSPLVSKVTKLISLAFASASLDKMGITVRISDLMAIYGLGVKEVLGDCDFFAGLLDLIAYIIERSVQCWHQGSLSPFFHSSKSYTDWADKSYSVIERSQLLANPEAAEVCMPTFLNDLDDCISTGITIQKFSKAADTKDLVASLLSRLRLLKGQILTRSAAGKSRPTPFTLMLFGGSSVGKTSLKHIAASHLAKVLNLPYGEDFIFTRSPGDAYWSGFRTQMWCVILDDMGYLNPNKAASDASVNECLQLINSTPWCPPQAELENKGTTPVRPTVVIGTTNTEHLNAQSYYTNWVAVLRRFEHVFEIKPKPEYAKDEAPSMIDPKKIPMTDPGCYPDLWIITHRRVLVDTNEQGIQSVKRLEVATYTDINLFLQVISRLAIEQQAQEANILMANKSAEDVRVCPDCYAAQSFCTCMPEVQASEFTVWSDNSPQWNLPATVPPVIPPTFDGWFETLESVAPSLGVAAATAAFSRCVGDTRITNSIANVPGAFRTYSRSVFRRLIAKLAKDACFNVIKNKWFQIIMATFVGLVACYKGYSQFREAIKAFDTQVQTTEKTDIMSEGILPARVNDEKPSPYVNNSRFHVELDTPSRSRSWKGLEFSDVLSRISNNVYYIEFERQIGTELGRTIGRALCVGGHLFVTDNHIIPSDTGTMRLIRSTTENGVSENIEKNYYPGMFHRQAESELVFFEVRDLPNHKSLVEIVPSAGYSSVCPGSMILRNSDGSVEYVSVPKLIKSEAFIERLGTTLSIWQGKCSDRRMGDCGSALVIRTPHGPMISGLHLLGGPGAGTACVSLNQEAIDLAIDYFKHPLVEPHPPMLQSSVRVVGLSNVHHKSVFRYLTSGHARHYGTTNLPRIMSKSKVKPSILREAAIKRGFKVDVGAPVMSGWKLWATAVQPIVNQHHKFDEALLRRCAENYVEEVYEGLSRSDRNDLRHPVNLLSAVNGMPGHRYFDSMKRNTSAGFPWCKSKRYVLKTLTDTSIWPDGVIPTEEVLERAGVMLDLYKAGYRVAPVFTAHKKDEPLSFKKVEAEKTRIMNGAPFDWSIVVRMYYMPAIWVMMRNKFLFEAMPGLVAQSDEWEDLYRHVTKFGVDRIVAGDYKDYDKNMGASIILEAFGVLISLYRKCGASEETLTVLYGISTDVAFAYTNFNGDLVEFFGSNPSGHPLTVVINCLVGSLYLRYAYCKLNPMGEVCDTFRDDVAAGTYGDDNIMGSRVDWFNHTAIASVLRDVGIVYTMADKEAESQPFIHISEATFLKRSWRWEPALKAHVCPLDLSSLDKMMTTWIPSDTVSAEAQAEDVCATATREFFWYGRETFEAKRAEIMDIFLESVHADYLTARTFPTWEQCVEAWCDASTVTGEWMLQTESITTNQRESGIPRAEAFSPRSNLKPKWGRGGHLLEQFGHKFSESGSTPSCAIPEITPYLGRVLAATTPTQTSMDIGVTLGVTSSQNTNTHKHTNKHVSQHLHPLAVIQSEETTEGVSSTTQQENVVFRDAGLITHDSYSMPNYRPDHDEAASLGQFLSRPVQVYNLAWSSANTSIAQGTFSPWANYFSDPTIRRKLENYARLRCTLKVKFLLNSSPFNYGSIRACYSPMNDGREVFLVGQESQQQVGFSQLPGTFLEPTAMTSVEMTLPYFNPTTWLNITRLADFTNMGNITFVQYAQLRSANGAATADARIIVYAWAENVEVAGLTTKATLQAKEEKVQGPISGVATAAANIASKLTDVPVIGPFARSAEVGAKLVAGVASIFGYSNPPVVTDVPAMIPRSFHGFANTDLSVPSEKLSLDRHNEVTIDNGVTGGPVMDELSILNFCKKESFVLGTQWNSSTAVDGSLWAAAVTPAYRQTVSLTGTQAIHRTPAAHLTNMFERWRGSIVYRFRFIKTKYHTGRVIISWDPQGLPGADAETNCFSRVVDIQMEDEVIVTIPYKASTAWLRVLSATPQNGANPVITMQEIFYNGVISIKVQNGLTGPAATSAIDILAFVSVGDDFEVSVPKELTTQETFYQIQSEEMIVGGAGSGSDLNTAAVTVGESVGSLRQILHRTSYYTTQPLGSINVDAANRYGDGPKTTFNLFPRYPVGPGYTPLGMNWATGILSATPQPYNFVAMHPMTYVTSCFGGFRGGIVHHFNTVSNNSNFIDSIAAERSDGTWVQDAARQARNRRTIVDDPGLPSTFARKQLLFGAGTIGTNLGQRGMALTNSRMQPAISIVTPQYSSFSFRTANGPRQFSNLSGQINETERIQFTARFRGGGTNDATIAWPFVDVYMAGAVDYTPVFFLSVPPMYNFGLPAAVDGFQP